MMKRLPAVLGYAVAVLTIAVAVVGPLFWFGVFSRAAAKTSLRIDPEYTGGEPARTIARDGYQIVVYKPVLKRAPLSPTASFVQIVWKPVSALPAAISSLSTWMATAGRIAWFPSRRRAIRTRNCASQ